LAFRGTDEWVDWTRGNNQAFTPKADQYERAKKLVDKLQKALGDDLKHITGHSLGGGLAAATSMIFNIPATTFNAAGVNPDTVILYAGENAWDPEKAKTLITNYRMQGEVLTTAQEKAHIGIFPTILSTLILPNAVGTQIDVQPFNKNDEFMSLLDRSLSPIDLHGMDPMMDGLLIEPPKAEVKMDALLIESPKAEVKNEETKLINEVPDEKAA
jgi:hypothetical protein